MTEPPSAAPHDGRVDRGRLAVCDHPEPADVAFLEDEVMAATVAATGHTDGRELAVLVRDDSGAICAGIYGWTWGGCCELQTLWVDPSLTGRGWGRALMEEAEEEARRRGCAQIVLFTHDVQAPHLYPRLGYAEVAVVEGYPAGGAAHWFRKPLAPLVQAGSSPRP